MRSVILILIAVFACVVFPASDARGALLFAEWATIDNTSNTASGSIGPVAVTLSRIAGSGNAFSGGVTDNSFTGFDNAVFAPPLPASDSVNFITTLSRFIYTITFDPAITNPRLHLYSHTSLLTFAGIPQVIPLTKLSGQDSFVVVGNEVRGEFNSVPTGLTDANGTVQLNGTFTSVTFLAQNFFGNDATALQIGADVLPDSILLSGDSEQTVISMPWIIDLTGDLTVINNPNLLDIDFGGLMTVGGEVTIANNTSATTIDASALVTVSGDLDISGNTSADAVNVSALVTASGDLTITDNTAATVVNVGGLETVSGDLTISGNTTADAVNVSALVTASGDLTITDNTAATVVNVGGLETVSGDLTISGNTSADAVNVSALVTASGELTITDNTSATVVNVGGLETVSGDLTISGNTSADAVNVSALVTASGDLTITDNTSATVVNVGGLETVSGDLTISGNTSADAVNVSALVTASGDPTITDNTAATVVNVGGLETVGGDLTLETTGSGAFDVSGAAVGGDTSLTTDGYPEVDAATAGGQTAVTMINSAATMELVLRTGTFPLDDPVKFSVTSLPGSVETIGDDTITHLAAYAFDFAIETLNLDATLNFEIDLVMLDEPSRQSLLDLLREGALLTLGVLGDAPGSELQLFDVCAGGGPVGDTCVVVEWLDENRMVLDPLDGIDPSILRLEGLVGHFSTYSFVAVSHAVPEPASALLLILILGAGVTWGGRRLAWRVPATHSP